MPPVKRPKFVLKELLKIFGLVALLVSCIGAGMYGALLNTTFSFTTVTGVVTLAGIETFLGAVLVESCIVMLIRGKKGKVDLQNVELPRESVVHYARNFLSVVSRKRGGLTALLVIGILIVAYRIGRPLYAFSIFREHLPEYVALATHTSPSEQAIASGRPEDANVVEEDDNDNPPPPPPRDDDEVAPPQQSGRESAPVDTNGQAYPAETKGGAAAGTQTKPVDTNGQGDPAPREKERPRPKTSKLVSLPVHGKILPIDANREAIDPVLLDLSDKMRPRRPDEVGAIAALWWWKLQVGHYGSGSVANEAYRWHCSVLVWDVRTKSLLAQSEFVGGPPPWVSIHGSSAAGTKPEAQVTDFLNSLVQQ